MRIHPIEPENADKQLKTVFASLEKMYGTALNPLRVLAHKPQAMRAVMQLYAAIHEHSATISDELKELISLRIAQINGCRLYCVPMHTYMLHKLGTSEDKIRSLVRYATSDLYTDSEKVALEYAERITVPSTTVTENLFGRLKVHYSDVDIVELTAVISTLNFWTKFIDALEIPLDDVFKEEPVST
jgi:uncharacterized peroxidase-related enzyme